MSEKKEENLKEDLQEESLQEETKASEANEEADLQEEQTADEEESKQEPTIEDIEKNFKEEMAKLDDKYKRSLAEFDNFRKRTIKEKANMYDDGVKATIEKMLPVIDNLERAIMSVKENEEGSLKQGILMVLKQFNDILSAMGVKEIEAKDKEFNPEFHLAVMHIEDESVGENIVVDVLQKGYIYKDKVVRYSTVKVAN